MNSNPSFPNFSMKWASEGERAAMSTTQITSVMVFLVVTAL
jgi:hypothetical protein